MAKKRFNSLDDLGKNFPQDKIKATIKRINPRGFCFVRGEGYQKDAFLHFSKLRGSGVEGDDLRENDVLEVTIVQGSRGFEVTKVFGKVGAEPKKEEPRNNPRPPRKQHQPIAKKKLKEIPESHNFYLHIHKRNRFHEQPTFDKRNRIENEKLSLYKINDTEKDKGDNKGEKIEKDRQLVSKRWEHALSAKINYAAINRRHKSHAKVIAGNHFAEQNLSTDHRLIVGLGGGSIFETSITLHHIYGFPYIPASAVKGVVRSYIVNTIWGLEEDAEAKAFRDCKDMCDIFGCGKETIYQKENGDKSSLSTYYQNQYNKDKEACKKLEEYKHPEIIEKTGSVIFFDAYPTRPPKIKADIMNPHYPDYYNDKQNKIPPADWQSPVPIVFLTVEDTPFQFMIGLRKGAENRAVVIRKDENNTAISGNILETVADTLKLALQNQGIGAKTAVGYGYFE